MRALWLILGGLTLAASWLGPLSRLAKEAFFAHMIMHMAVVAIAAPLLALGLLDSRWDPARRFPSWFAPIPASVLELIVVWAWHAPALHHAARHAPGGIIAEQATFLISGFVVWMSAIGGAPHQRAEKLGAGIAALLLTSMHMTLLGALLALTPRPLYNHVAGFGSLTALEDQHLGGAIMLLVGGIAYLLGGLVLTVHLLKARSREVSA